MSCWTLVHPITEETLFQFTKDDFANTQGENTFFVKHLMICLVTR
jgi:inward rectifier potassium channel